MRAGHMDFVRSPFSEEVSSFTSGHLFLLNRSSSFQDKSALSPFNGAAILSVFDQVNRVRAVAALLRSWESTVSVPSLPLDRMLS